LRIVLTILAVLLISVLTAALIGPYFVDWSAQRDAVAAQLSRVLGEPIHVRGAIDLRLLPSPYITLGQVEIADPKNGGPLFACDHIRLELGLTALVRGQFRFTQAWLDHPTIDLRRGADGGVLLPDLDMKARSDSIALDDVVIHDGRLRVAGLDGGAPLSIEGLELDAEAGSLMGPFKGSGSATALAGKKASFHFASGIIEEDALRFKAVIDAGAGLPRTEFDGALEFANGASRSGVVAAGYAGAATFSGSINGVDAPMPWRASGVLKANLRSAALDNLTVHLGPEDRALAMDGSAQVDFGATPKANLALTAKQLNFDTLLRAENEDSTSPTKAFEALSAALGSDDDGPGPPIALALQFDTPAVILGGDTIADVSLSATSIPGSPLTGKLEASPPGRSHILASGAIDLHPASGFKGKMDVRIEEVQRLRDWLTLGAPELQARLAAIGDVLPYRSASAAGDVDLSAAGFIARNLNLTLERSTLTGTLAFTRAIGADRGRMFADLQTDSLDLDALPNVSASRDFLGGADLSLALDAKAIRVAKLGEGQVDGGSMKLKLTREGDDVRLERLSIADLGGASVEANGAADTKGRWLNAKIDAARLRDFALLLRRVAPGPASEILVDRSGSLSPTKLTFAVQSSRVSGIDAFADSLTVQGVAGVTQVGVKLDRAADDPDILSATITLDAPDTAPLLRQIGLPALSLAAQGRGHVAASAHGRWSDGLDADVTASLAGADLTWRGRIRPQAPDVENVLVGLGGVKAANVIPLLAALGVAPSDSAFPMPIDLSTDIAAGAEKLGLSRLKGTVGRAHFGGDVTYRSAPQPSSPAISTDPDVALAQAVAGDPSAPPAAQIQGSLTVDRLPLSALTGLALGASQPVRAGALWSDAKFSQGLVNPPTADVGLKIATLDIADNLVGRDVSLRLQLGRGLVGLNDLTMNVAGGALAGHATIRRDGPNASLSGAFSLEPVTVDRPNFVGRISGAADFAGSGQSTDALVAGLAGSGRVRLAGAQIPHLDQGALGRIIEKAQAQDYAIDQTNVTHALDLELNKQALRVADAEAPVSITAGTVRLGPFYARDVKDTATLLANFNIRAFALEIRAAFAEAQAPSFWSGPPPSVNVILKGPIDAPTREIDSGVLVAGLAAAALARETERIAALESDIRERAFFNRRLKAGQFMRRRELELESFAADQARLKSEADRRRVEAETLKADEDRRKAVAPPAAPETVSPAAIPIPDEIQQLLMNQPPPTPPAKPKEAPGAAPRSDPTASGLY
jgi:uncharacterized protein involved in outer membrane biogenesis